MNNIRKQVLAIVFMMLFVAVFDSIYIYNLIVLNRPGVEIGFRLFETIFFISALFVCIDLSIKNIKRKNYKLLEDAAIFLGLSIFCLFVINFIGEVILAFLSFEGYVLKNILFIHIPIVFVLSSSFYRAWKVEEK